MRTLLAALAATLTLAIAAPAHAVTYQYCAHSLTGGGNLQPDDDIRAEWDRIQANGYDLVSSYAEQWYGPSGAYFVQARWVFIRRNGYAFRRYFGCWSSGSTYADSAL